MTSEADPSPSSGPATPPHPPRGSIRMHISPELLLRQMYDEVQDFAIITLDTDSLITSWNVGARHLFGFEEHEALGASTAITFTAEDLDQGQPFGEMALAAEQGRAADYRWHKRKDGSRFWADGVLTGIRTEEGELVGYLKIVRDITERKEAQDEIRRLASIDAVTGLYNRASFDTRRVELTASATRSGQKLLLFMIDLDRFKEVNDTYGHQAGDQLLAEAGARIRGISRDSDFVARIGGDEFALFQMNPASPLLGATLASKILFALDLPFKLDNAEVRISGSIGIAVFPDDAGDADSLLKCADLALYEAKTQGRNGYHYFTPELDALAHRRNRDQGELKRLERDKRFWLAYQPIVDAQSGQTVAMEALLRFPGPVLNQSSVDYVVELAKEIGLIVNIGNWVFEQASSQLRRWRDEGHHAIRIAVNTCSKELLAPSYLPNIMKVLQQYGLSPADIYLEMTERDAIDLDRSPTTIVQRLANMGFRLVLDDFGTGYSSLSYLRALPVTGLKLDKSFLKGVPDEADANAVARAVITLARDLRLGVTAEGVEHPVQMRFLRDAGCHAFQGFLFAPPMAEEAASRWLREQAAGPAPPEQQ
ncbi:MAG: putative bifunctional diguanylate cyclase/phosphodiesterase [Massilia sp.]